MRRTQPLEVVSQFPPSLHKSAFKTPKLCLITPTEECLLFKFHRTPIKNWTIFPGSSKNERHQDTLFSYHLPSYLIANQQSSQQPTYHLQIDGYKCCAFFTILNIINQFGQVLQCHQLLLLCSKPLLFDSAVNINLVVEETHQMKLPVSAAFPVPSFLILLTWSTTKQLAILY